MESVTWTALEFEPQDRHRDWNWYAGLVTGIAAVIAFSTMIFFLASLQLSPVSRSLFMLFVHQNISLSVLLRMALLSIMNLRPTH